MKKDAILMRRPLTYETVATEITKAKDAGFRNIDFYGGEPLTYPFITNAIALANKLSLSCFLATNATKFKSQKFTHDFFNNVRIKELRTTLHSHHPGIHDRITGIKGSYQNTIKGILNILRARKTSVNVNVVINSLNYKKLPETADFILNLKVNSATFSGLIFEGALLNNPWLYVDLDKVRPLLLEAFKKCQSSMLGVRLIKLPACILGKNERKPRRLVREINPKLIKLHSCKRCSYDKICPGIDCYQVSAFGIPAFLKNV
jgi:MoaA/NifB/PqqE/SkfB family radical SAM enzyme